MLEGVANDITEFNRRSVCTGTPLMLSSILIFIPARNIHNAWSAVQRRETSREINAEDVGA
jgi:hypothetical protein